MLDPVEAELSQLSPDVLRLVKQRDSAARLLEDLPYRFTPQDIAEEGPKQRAWELAGVRHKNAGRFL
jgi:hypothetical protein